MFALALVNVDADLHGTTADTASLRGPHPDQPLRPTRAPDDGGGPRCAASARPIASTLTSARAERSLDNVDSGQRRYEGPDARPRDGLREARRSSRSRETTRAVPAAL